MDGCRVKPKLGGLLHQQCKQRAHAHGPQLDRVERYQHLTGEGNAGIVHTTHSTKCI